MFSTATAVQNAPENSLLVLLYFVAFFGIGLLATTNS